VVGNYLYYGDNLYILRHNVADESVDLIYLDPPFKSDRNYNVLFKEKSGEASPSQIQAFTDTWEWDRVTEAAFEELIDHGPHNVATMISAMREFVGKNDMMAYLVMMAQRLVELHRVLKPTGSLYLHCDPTASHYLKILLDTIFGARNFRSEISWKRTSAHSDAKQGRENFGHIRDVILFYSKSDNYTWNVQHTPYDQEYIDAFYRHVEPETGRRYRLGDLTGPGGAAKGNPYYEVMGVNRYWRYSKARMDQLIRDGRVVQSRPGAVPAYKRYLDEMLGVPLQDSWDDIKPIGAQAKERLGYPTQKPLALLERIIAVSSNPGDVLLDPFCGCGTGVIAAQKLERQWIGIDITHLSIALVKNRLVDTFGETLKFEILGEPEDVGSARMLAENDRYEFQRWANSLVNAQPIEGQDKKGADRGIDGVIRFVDEADGKLKRVLVQVKSGHVGSPTMRDLKGTLDREKAEMAMLVTLEPPTKPMRQEAVEAGTYYSPGWNREFPKVQILTIEELISGVKPDVPPMRATFERAQRIKRASSHAQASLLDI
jgi:DNA modification methylase